MDFARVEGPEQLGQWGLRAMRSRLGMPGEGKGTFISIAGKTGQDKTRHGTGF